LPPGKYKVWIEMISYTTPPDFNPVPLKNDQHNPERNLNKETADKTIREITKGPNDITITLDP